MSRIRTVQTNFTAGVLDESMRSRIDLAVYRNGIKRGDNIRLRPQGGGERRAGSTVVDEFEHGIAQVASFVFDDDEAYVCFFSEGRIDVYDRITRETVFIENPTGHEWTEDHVAGNELSFLQQYDKMFIMHGDFKTAVLRRVGIAEFTVDELDFDFDQTSGAQLMPQHKYLPVSIYALPGGVGPGASTMTVLSNFWTSEMIGFQFRFEGRAFTVTSIVSPLIANINILEEFPLATASINWEEPAFSPWRGWIRCMGLHEQRLWIGGGASAPNVLWGSVSGAPLNFDLGTAQNDDAIKYAISSSRVVDIKAIESFTHLQIFTTSGEYFAPKPSSGGLTPGNFSVNLTSVFGSGTIKPRVFDQSTIFLTRNVKALREFTYDDIVVSYAADSLSLMSKAMAPSPTDLDVQMEGTGDEQEARAYIPNEDGTIGILSKIKKESVAAWSRWTTQGSYKGLAVVGNEVWLLVERTIAGVTASYIEVVDNDMLLDFGASSSGAASTSWGPFDLHKGQSVHVLSGDLYFGELTVDAVTGMIELPIAVTEVQIGLNFTPTIEPLMQEVQLADGISMGEPKRYVSCTAILEDSLTCKIKNRLLPNGLPTEDPGVAPERFSGPFRAQLLGWSKTETPLITAPVPLPFKVNSLVFEVEV